MRLKLLYGKRRISGYLAGKPPVIEVDVCHKFESDETFHVGIFPKVLPAKCELLCDGSIRERKSGG
jgi:hypothetical protein